MPWVPVFSVTNSSGAVIEVCTARVQQHGFELTNRASAPTQTRIFNNFCLQAPGTNNSAKVSIVSCVDGDARQQWMVNPNGQIQWGGFFRMCLDLTNGQLPNSNQISSCGPYPKESLLGGPSFSFRFGYVTSIMPTTIKSGSWLL